MQENIVEICNLSKKFESKILFENFNITLQKGEFVAITGESGKGKSTLLNIIGLLEKMDSGSLKINAVVNPRLNRKSGNTLLRYTIGYLFQNFALIDNETVDYNLNLALRFSKLSKQEKSKQKEDALQKVGLPKTDLKKKIYKMSGGEQQRVALARLMLKPCSLILADEPTGSLDAENRDKVMGILKWLNDQGKTVVVVTHDEYVANFQQDNSALMIVLNAE